MIEKGKNLNKVVENNNYLLKIRKDVTCSYIIQMFYTTYKEVTACMCHTIPV